MQNKEKFYLIEITKWQTRALMNFLGRELKQDPVKTVLVDMTPLGLVEITRKKVRKTLKEQAEE